MFDIKSYPIDLQQQLERDIAGMKLLKGNTYKLKHLAKNDQELLSAMRAVLAQFQTLASACFHGCPVVLAAALGAFEGYILTHGSRPIR